MTTWFISDIHLSDTRPEITALFFDFLKSKLRPHDTLYILGDFFEYWVGDDEQSKLQKQVEKALNKISQKDITVYFMHGNRDFLIGADFCKKANCILLADPHLITLNQERILLMHGDSLCQQDISYQRFRKVVRNRLVQKLFLKLPLDFRKKLALSYRKKSHSSTQKKDSKMMDTDEKSVDEIMASYQCDRLIHGHTHKPCVHQVGDKQRIVLGSWDDATPEIIRADAESIQLISLKTSIK